MVNDFASVLEHMDRILNNKYLFRTIQGLEVIVKYLEEQKDKEALEKEVNKDKEFNLIIIKINKKIFKKIVHKRMPKIKRRKKRKIQIYRYSQFNLRNRKKYL